MSRIVRPGLVRPKTPPVDVASMCKMLEGIHVQDLAENKMECDGDRTGPRKSSRVSKGRKGGRKGGRKWAPGLKQPKGASSRNSRTTLTMEAMAAVALALAQEEGEQLVFRWRENCKQR